MDKVGQQIKQAIRGQGLNMEQAASKLGLSRANFYYHLTKTPPEPEFLQSVKTKLGIDVTITDKTKGTSSIRQIPISDTPVAASPNLSVFQDSHYPTRYLTVPGFEDCDFAKTVYGHSMYPTYENGSLIACKEIKNRKVIRWGEAYYIVTTEYEMLKRLQQSEKKGHVLLCSDNEETRRDGRRKYEPMEISEEEIKKMYMVRLALKPIA